MNLYRDHTDLELVALLVRGDARAFETIYRRYVRELYAYTRKNIPTKEESEEIIHDVFEEIWLRRHKLVFVTQLKGYLYRLVRFRIVKYFRQEKVRQRYAEHYAMFEAIYDSFSEDAFEPDAIQLMIDRTLSKLPERCQEAVTLRLRENLSNDDIARRMNIKKSTVENYMVVALSHLRAAFHGYKMS